MKNNKCALCRGSMTAKRDQPLRILRGLGEFFEALYNQFPDAESSRNEVIPTSGTSSRSRSTPEASSDAADGTNDEELPDIPTAPTTSSTAAAAEVVDVDDDDQDDDDELQLGSVFD